MSMIDDMRVILREDDIPFYTNEELNFYLNKNKGVFDDAVYECLIVKAESTQLQVAGLVLQDSSAYFRRLADRYKPRHSGVLKNGV